MSEQLVDRVLDALQVPSDAILHVIQPGYPEFRFEFHQKTKRVYYIRRSSPGIGRLLAMHIDNDGAAQNAVLVFLRGYQEAKYGIEYTITEGAA